MDINEILPIEILHKIFTHFSQNEILVTAPLVCKKWRSIARDPSMLKKLIITKGMMKSYEISERSFQELVENYPKISHFQCEFCDNFGCIIEALGRNCHESEIT